MLQNVSGARCVQLKHMLSKTHYVVLKFNKAQIPLNMIIKIGDEILKEKENVKFLGLYIDNKLNWQEHIKNLKSKLNSSIYAMNKVKRQLNTNILTTLYYTLIYPYIDYGITLWGSAYSTHLKKIMVMQKKSVRIIVKAKYNEYTDPIFK